MAACGWLGSRKGRRPDRWIAMTIQGRTWSVPVRLFEQKPEILFVIVWRRRAPLGPPLSLSSSPSPSLLSCQMFNWQGRKNAEDGNRIPKTGITIGTKLKNEAGAVRGQTETECRVQYFPSRAQIGRGDLHSLEGYSPASRKLAHAAHAGAVNPYDNCIMFARAQL
jgi:hypothetical protein